MEEIWQKILSVGRTHEKLHEEDVFFISTENTSEAQIKIISKFFSK